MAVPKTTETKYTDGSVQARQVVKRLHNPYIFYFTSVTLAMRLLGASVFG